MKIGIYGLRNKTNNKWYVGQSVDIESRWGEYRLLRCQSQPKLYNALLKYGYDGFEPQLLEECDVASLPDKEAYWVKVKDSVKNGYNCKSGGFMGGKHSEETKEKLRQMALGRKCSEETKAKHREWRPTTEQKEKISKALIGNQYRKGIPHKEETKAKVSASLKGRPKSPETREKMRLARLKYNALH